MDDSFEDSCEELSDEYLSEEYLTAEITIQEKAAQRKDRHRQKNAEFILENQIYFLNYFLTVNLFKTIFEPIC